MCEVTPYMVSVATKRGISVIYHSMALLISTTGVVYISLISRLLGILLTYTPAALGPVALGLWVYISAKSLAAVV